MQPNRAQRRLLDLDAPPAPRPDDTFPLTGVIVHATARRQLRDLLHTTGRVRGGPLFGAAEAGQFHVHALAPAGPPGWHRETDPLVTDGSWLLGWSDAAQLLSGGRSDWAGHWVVLPLRSFPDAAELLHWQERAWQAGVLDMEHPLLIPGWRDGLTEISATCMRPDGGAYTLPVHSGTGHQGQ